MRVADEVPYNWWERATNNQWYDRETRRVVLPDAIKDKRNVVMTLEEMKAYLVVLDAMHADVTKERNTLHASMLALEKGYFPSWRRPEDAKVFHLCRGLEFMVTMAKHKLACTKFFCDFAKRAVNAQKEATMKEEE